MFDVRWTLPQHELKGCPVDCHQKVKQDVGTPNVDVRHMHKELLQQLHQPLQQCTHRSLQLLPQAIMCQYIFINSCKSCSHYVCKGCSPNDGRYDDCRLFKCYREMCDLCNLTRSSSLYRSRKMSNSLSSSNQDNDTNVAGCCTIIVSHAPDHHNQIYLCCCHPRHPTRTHCHRCPSYFSRQASLLQQRDSIWEGCLSC